MLLIPAIMTAFLSRRALADNRLSGRIIPSGSGSLADFKRAKASAAIMAAAGDRRPAHGEMVCPVCGAGTLRWFVMPNHHVHAECSVPGCICWVE